MTTKMIFPTQRKTRLPVKWQRSRAKKSSDPPRTVMMILHLTRKMRMTTTMRMIRAIPMAKRQSEGRWPTIRAIRIAISEGDLWGKGRLHINVITNQMALHRSHESGV